MESKSHKKLLNDTLRQIEKLILFAIEGRYPRTDDVLLYLIHEGILQMYAPRWPDGSIVRSRHLDDDGLVRLVTGAMKELSEQNLPPEIDLRDVESAVATFKNSIFTKAMNSCKTMEELYEIGNYCWACFRNRHLDRHHIVTRGSRPDLKENPDNILLLCRHCHRQWHDMGMGDFLIQYSHLAPRVERALDL